MPQVPEQDRQATPGILVDLVAPDGDACKRAFVTRLGRQRERGKWARLPMRDESRGHERPGTGPRPLDPTIAMEQKSRADPALLPAPCPPGDPDDDRLQGKLARPRKRTHQNGKRRAEGGEREQHAINARDSERKLNVRSGTRQSAPANHRAAAPRVPCTRPRAGHPRPRATRRKPSGVRETPMRHADRASPHRARRARASRDDIAIAAARASDHPSFKGRGARPSAF